MSKYEIGNLGVGPVMRPQLTVVNEGGPAAKAGLQRGDVITAVNGQHLDQPKIVDLIHASTGKPLTLTIDRAGAVRDVTVVPEDAGGVGVMNVQISPFEVRRIEPNLAQAFIMSAQKNWTSAVAIGDTLKGLFRGRTPVKQLMGPVAIAQLSGSAARLGWIYLFELMAMISLNLGLINLLPIPVMDGGQIAILGFEGLIRRELSLKIKERILLAGAAVIVLLMVTVIYNDIMRLVK
jgi:regulator of sigma E protease